MELFLYKVLTMTEPEILLYGGESIYLKKFKFIKYLYI